jgi:acetyl esterase/lipase
MAVPPDLPDAVVRYDDHADGLLDVHVPEAPNGATVLLVHGGFWKTSYDRTHTRPLAVALAAAGFLVATPEYRRVGPGGGGGWPTTGEDVLRAATLLPGLLAEVGQEPGTLRVVGHSAGGHLALWLASQGLPIDRVVALAPVCDLRAATRLRLGSDATPALLGSADPDEADPMVLFDRRPDAAVTVVHGTGDDVVPVELSRGLVARHPWVGLVELPVDHFDVITPHGPAYDALLAALGDRPRD